MVVLVHQRLAGMLTENLADGCHERAKLNQRRPVSVYGNARDALFGDCAPQYNPVVGYQVREFLFVSGR